MVQRVGLLMLLVAGVFAFTAGDAAACHHGGGCYSYSCCYYPFCHYPCYCLAYADPYNQRGYIIAKCPCCPHHLPAWSWCEVVYGAPHQWGWVKAIYCFRAYGEAEAELKKLSAAPAPAAMEVTLPGDAKLTINKQETGPTGASRRFVSPELQRGKDYIYVLKAEATRDGKLVEVTKQVTVRAGEETKVRLEFPAAKSPVIAQK